MKKLISISKIPIFPLFIFLLINPIQAAIESDQKPNIVLVLMDNFGYGEIGVYGGVMAKLVYTEEGLYVVHQRPILTVLQLRDFN